MREARADSSAQDLVVKSLKVVDEKGKLRAAIGFYKHGPALDLYDEKGKPIWDAP